MTDRSGRSRLLLATLALLLAVSGRVAEATGVQEAVADGGVDEASERLPGVAATVAGLERRAGLLTLWVDADRGKVFLELPPPGDDGGQGRFLYASGLLTGLGSNPVGLDRGQQSDSRLVRFRRVGGRLLIEQENLRFRALSDDPLERLAVSESFATSVLWGAPLTALDGDGRALVDFTPFLLRDALGVTAAIKQAGQGDFGLDPERSAVDPAACLVFPDNVELEAVVTWSGSDAGRLVAETAPSPDAVTLVQHLSFVRLPEPGYLPRRFDPRAGSFSVDFLDYGSGLDEPLDTRWIVRHRLQKKNPGRASSPVIEPIVYYVDPGTPEPVRSALVEGASWWADAFAAAGFEDAFRVELLPPGAHPLDARYNVIQWVHRSTRGWSYGGGLTDPRTGERIKGHVWLGSLRVRQDRLIFEGLAGTAKTGSGADDDPIELALARIRQLAAHEVGHALGLNHNFAASSYDGRASVMDYPAPLVRVGGDGGLDFSDAYAVGVGSWDRFAIRYAYAETPPGGDEEELLAEILVDGEEHLFITDHDARPPGAAHPLANLWDNGADPVAALDEVLAVRRVALERFGAGNLAVGRPLALLHEVLVPVYLYHRYQIEATVKSVGGRDYRYAVREPSPPPASARLRPVPAARQRAALEAVLAALRPAELDLPDEVLDLILPRPAGYERPNRELFASATAPVFDPVGIAATAAGLAVDGLLQPERLARLVDQHRRDADLPGLDEVLDRLLETVFETSGLAPRRAEIRRTTQWVTVGRLLELAARPELSATLRAPLEGRLRRLHDELAPGRPDDPSDDATRRFLAAEIARFGDRSRVDPGREPTPFVAPPGSPIGAGLPGTGFLGACTGSP